MVAASGSEMRLAVPVPALRNGNVCKGPGRDGVERATPKERTLVRKKADAPRMRRRHKGWKLEAGVVWEAGRHCTGPSVRLGNQRSQSELSSFPSEYGKLGRIYSGKFVPN
jgi:hypothetical protein